MIVFLNNDSYKKLSESINIDSDNNYSDDFLSNYYKHRRFIDQSSPSTNSRNFLKYGLRRI
jgi:hypothetical protein